MSSECACEVSAQNTTQIFIIACQSCPFLGVRENTRFEPESDTDGETQE